MGLSTKMKRKKTSTKLRASAIKSLPSDLLKEVLAKVASSSFTDLFNAKLCCKDFLAAAEDNYILQHVSIEKFLLNPWLIKDEESSFLQRCEESGNAEALYRLGMVEYFSSMRLESGLEYLKRAADKGHVEASYVYGIILLCTQGQSDQQGIKLLSAVKNSKSRNLKIQECQKRTKAVIRSMWINNYIVRRQEPCCHKETCIENGKMQDGQTERRGAGWPSSDNEEDGINDRTCCEACSWDREVNSFCNMLRGRPDPMQ